MSRKGSSKLDPYEDFVIGMISAGSTYRDVADALMEKYGLYCTDGCISRFINLRGIKSKVSRGKNAAERVNIPICENCEFYDRFRSGYGNYNTQVCLKEKRIMYRVYTSPQWCPHREIRKDVE